MIDFSIAVQSRLRQKGELDVLFGVSYPMTNAYLNGKSYPRGANRAHIDFTMQILKALIDTGKLPLSPDRDAEQRAKAVLKIKDYIETKKKTN